MSEIIWYYLYFWFTFKCPQYKAYLYHEGQLKGYSEGDDISGILEALTQKSTELGCINPKITETKCP